MEQIFIDSKISTLFILFLVIVGGLCVSCETAIDLDLPEYESKLVIEGTIENGEPAIVCLSKSNSYYSEIDFETLMNSIFISDAEVFVSSSDGEQEQLTYEYCADSPYYFAFVGHQLLGKENTTYTLTVNYNNQTYTAETTIPHTFDIDSAWFSAPSELINADTMRTIQIILTDNAAENNYYSFKVKVACPRFTDRLWVSTLPLVFNDKTFNGLTFNYELERYGTSTLFSSALSEEEQRDQNRITFRPGDTVYIKNSQIDYNTYRFMMTGGSEAVNGSNPFTSPAPVESNIEGENVLGAWCGYASKITKLVWPDTIGYNR